MIWARVFIESYVVHHRTNDDQALNRKEPEGDPVAVIDPIARDLDRLERDQDSQGGWEESQREVQMHLSWRTALEPFQLGLGNLEDIQLTQGAIRTVGGGRRSLDLRAATVPRGMGLLEDTVTCPNVAGIAAKIDHEVTPSGMGRCESERGVLGEASVVFVRVPASIAPRNWSSPTV